MLSNYFILYLPLSPFAFNLSQHQGLFQWVGSSHHVAKVLELQHQSFQSSGLIFFRIDWFDLAHQGTLKSLLQHYNSKASRFWSSAFLRVQYSHTYITTGKAIDLTISTFLGKVLYLFFNMLSRFVIGLLPRSKCLIFCGFSHHPQWFWSPRKWSLSLFPLFPHLFALSDGTRCHKFSFLNVEF